MTENTARDEEPRKASSAPGLEGEGGQYVEGDYGDAGAVGGAEEQPEEGDYPEGNYGDAGTVGPGRGAEAAREVEEDEEKNS